jgi:hypothetical protein
MQRKERGIWRTSQRREGGGGGGKAWGGERLETWRRKEQNQRSFESLENECPNQPVNAEAKRRMVAAACMGGGGARDDFKFWRGGGK